MIKNNECKNSFFMMKQLADICPVIFIQGNHDLNDTNYKELCDKLNDMNVIVLNNDTFILDDQICFTGLLNNLNIDKDYLEQTDRKLNFYNICLIHSPKYFKNLNNSDFDLFLSGHTHGCQWRFPLIGGIFSPDYGFLPGKDYGLKYYNKTFGIINRGIGNNTLITRLNNFPELIVLDIASTKN